MEQIELTDDEREMLAWVESWKVDPVVSDEDTMDLVVTMTRPPWIREDAGETELDNPDEIRVTFSTEMPPFLWDALPSSDHEKAYRIMRVKAWEEIIAPSMLGGDDS